jgi:hypothetical protein
MLQLAGKFTITFASSIDLSYTVKYFEDDDVNEERLSHDDLSRFENRKEHAWINPFFQHELEPKLSVCTNRSEYAVMFGIKRNPLHIPVVHGVKAQKDNADELYALTKSKVMHGVVMESASRLAVFLMFHGAACPDWGETLPTCLEHNYTKEFSEDYPENSLVLHSIYDLQSAYYRAYEILNTDAMDYPQRPSPSNWDLLYCCFFWIRKYLEAAKMQFDEIKATNDSMIDEVKSYFTPLRRLLNEKLVELSDAIGYLASAMSKESASVEEQKAYVVEKSNLFLNRSIESDKVSPQVLKLLQSLDSDMVLVDSLFKEVVMKCAGTWEIRWEDVQSEKKSASTFKSTVCKLPSPACWKRFEILV